MQPLNLPKGSVRAIFLILFSIFIFAYFWVFKTMPDPFFEMWVGVVALYFGSRLNFNKNQSDE